ncbi:MAG: sugar phosphate isomerase [Verrucomicrobiales bacterium]|jgi:sugar phosphate isomerase/epimerase|nr:sugar phosphate isomerase [Verrucomicrobiales bacterium]
MRSAVTISLVPQAKGGPFVFWDDLPNAAAEAARLGFDAIEIFAPSPAVLDAETLRKIFQQNQLQLAALGTGAGWVIHKWHLSHSDPAVRAKAVAFVKEMITFGSAFGAPAILGSMQGRYEGAVSRKQALSWLAEALNVLGEHAAACNVPLLYEPLNRYETNLLNRAEDVVTFVRSLTTKNVKVLADVFHLNIEEASLPDAIRTYGELVGHLHFADNNRRAVGFGGIDYAPIVAALREIKFEGYVSGEVLPWPDPQSAARQTIASYHKLFGVK